MKTAIFLCLCGFLQHYCTAQLLLNRLRISGKDDFAGIDLKDIRFPWHLKSSDRGVMQTPYELHVRNTSTDAPLTYVGSMDLRNLYGEDLALLAQLNITYSDGASETICSDCCRC